ncbi:MAG: hypothetical protein Q9226_001887 [Calogaya cf. arnoldii]
MYSIPPSPTALTINGLPSPLSLTTPSLENIPTTLGRSAGNDKPAGSPKDQVAADAQQQPGDAINPPLNPPSNNEATAPSNNQAFADLPLPPGGTTNPPGKTTTNSEPAPPKAQDVANPQAQIASFIMNAFGPAIGSAVPGVASPKADSPSATIGKPPSRVSKIRDPVVPLDPTTIDNIGTAGSPPSAQRESAVSAIPHASPVVIAGKSLQPGSSITVPGTTYAPPSQATEILVNGTPSPLPVPLGSANKVSANANGRPVDAIAVAISSITPGAPAITVSGTTYSRPPTGNEIFVNGSPIPVPAGVLHTAAVQSAVVIVSHTLSPGQFITFSGTTYSRPSTGTEIFVNGSPSPVPLSLINTAPFQSKLLFGSQTLRSGEVMTVSGKVISGPTTYLNSPTGTEIFINGSPSPVSTVTLDAAPIQSAFAFGSQTLQPGQAITVSGTVISLPATGTGKIIVDSQIATLAESRLAGGTDKIVFANNEGSLSVTVAVIDTSSLPDSAPSQAALAIGSQTLQRGEAIIVSGTIISLPATGTGKIVVDGQTAMLAGNRLAGGPRNSIVFASGHASVTAAVIDTSLLPDSAPTQATLVIASQTLQTGQVITISGTVISLPATGTGNIMVDGQTATLAENRLGSGPGDTIVFANSEVSVSVTAALAETRSDSTSVVGTAMSTSEAAKSASGIPSGSASEATDIPSSGDSADGAGGSQGAESLAVKSARVDSWINTCIGGVGILVAFAIIW